MKPYVIQNGFSYLVLVGPFAYGRWVQTLTDDMAMSYPKACAWAAVYGGVVVPFAGAASPYAGVA